MLNHTAEYALRAVLHLAERAPAEPVHVGAIAEALDVPRNYLSKVLHLLAREGVLASQRGPNGGFFLGRPVDQLTLADVIGPFDPIDDRCLLIRRRCSDVDPCTAHHEWKDVALRIRRFFRKTTVADLIASAAAVGRPAMALVTGADAERPRAAPAPRREPSAMASLPDD